MGKRSVGWIAATAPVSISMASAPTLPLAAGTICSNCAVSAAIPAAAAKSKNIRSSVLRALDLSQPIGTLQHVTRLAAVGWPDDAFALHHVQDACRAAVAQAQPPLQRGSGRLAHLQHHAYRVLIHGILGAVVFLAVFRTAV